MRLSHLCNGEEANLRPDSERFKIQNNLLLNLWTKHVAKVAELIQNLLKIQK